MRRRRDDRLADAGDHRLTLFDVLRVDLAAFDDADFTELVERASSEGPSRIRSCASA